MCASSSPEHSRPTPICTLGLGLAGVGVYGWGQGPSYTADLALITWPLPSADLQCCGHLAGLPITPSRARDGAPTKKVTPDVWAIGFIL